MIAVGEVRKRYGVPESTVYYFVRTGRLPAVDVTQPWHTKRRMRFRPSDLDRVFGPPKAERGERGPGAG